MFTYKFIYVNIVYFYLRNEMMKWFLVLICMSLYSYAQSAEEIAMKSFLAISGYDGSEAVMTMVLKNAKGVENKRKLRVLRKEEPLFIIRTYHFIT